MQGNTVQALFRTLCPTVSAEELQLVLQPVRTLRWIRISREGSYTAVERNEVLPRRQHLKKLSSYLAPVPSLPREDKLHPAEYSIVLLMIKFYGKAPRTAGTRLRSQEICKPRIPGLNS